MSFFKMDADSALSDIRIFRWTAYSFIAFAVITAVVIIMTEIVDPDLKWDTSFTGFNFAFFTVFKVPLAILATGIAIVSVIAAIHRSAQTKLQIDKSTEQNVFTNFYKHRQEYLDHFKGIESDLPKFITERTMRDYYNSSFPKNFPTNLLLKPDNSWIDELDLSLIKLAHQLRKIIYSKNANVVIALINVYLKREASIRKNLYLLPSLDKAIIPANEKNTFATITYEHGQKENTEIGQNIFPLAFVRLKQYLSVIEKLRFYSDEGGGSILPQTNVYNVLLSLEFVGDIALEKSAIKSICQVRVFEVKLTDNDTKLLKDTFAEIESEYTNTLSLSAYQKRKNI